MSEKCKRIAGGELQHCPDMQQAISLEYVAIQSLRNHESGNRRERLAIVKKKISFPLLYCPWCRADIDTQPREKKANNAS